jgi:hypothetical protein
MDEPRGLDVLCCRGKSRVDAHERRSGRSSRDRVHSMFWLRVRLATVRLKDWQTEVDSGYTNQPSNVRYGLRGLACNCRCQNAIASAIHPCASVPTPRPNPCPALR